MVVINAIPFFTEYARSITILLKSQKKYPNIPTHELLQKYWVKDETGQVAK